MSNESTVVAFVLLVTDSDRTANIFKHLKEMELVKEVYMIYGDYDLILKIELSNLAQLTSFMMDLRKQFAIKKSSTLITLSE